MSEIRKKITFISLMDSSPWGGSEALWSAAAGNLLRAGHAVSISVHDWPTRPVPLVALASQGAKICVRMFSRRNLRFSGLDAVLQPFKRRFARRAFIRWLKHEAPDLICLSNGWILDHLGLMRICLESGIPYVVVIHANAEHWWPGDQEARQLIAYYQKARRVFFVSRANRQLLENQLAITLNNAEVIHNPVNVTWDAAPPWPDNMNPVRLACVGRLDPAAKGQDLLLQLLASDLWKSREVVLSFYGRGDNEDGLRRLVTKFGLEEQVRFCGQEANVETIWETHHVLVLPSRYEGLPLVTVEAMLCGRPVIVTDVAGNNEIVQDEVTGFIAEAPTLRHLSEAMERAWERRAAWQSMGQVAARVVRDWLPRDPAAVFAARLLQITASASK